MIEEGMMRGRPQSPEGDEIWNLPRNFIFLKKIYQKKNNNSNPIYGQNHSLCSTY